jgi:4-carboxymuconolactone decarboxylase
MPRVPYRELDGAPEPMQRVIERTPLALLRVIAHADSAFEPWLAYSDTLLRRLALDPQLRELAILQVAHLCSSDYEWTQHVPIAQAFGATAEQIEALAAGDDERAGADEAQRAVLAFTRAVVLHGDAGEAAVAQLLALLDERRVVELLLVIGNYMGLARLIATVGLESHEPVFASTAQRLGGGAP